MNCPYIFVPHPTENRYIYEIEALHSDDFIANIIDLYPFKVFNDVETVRSRLRYPPKSFDEYLEILLK